MKDTLSMIVATIFLVILLLLLPLYNYFERQDDISYNVALKAVTTFVDEVTNNGYIDQTSYDNFINRLGQTANSYDVQVEVQKRLLTNDPNGNGETYIEQYQSYFNKDIFNEETGRTSNIIDRDNSLKNDVFFLDEGDKVYVNVKNTNTTMEGNPTLENATPLSWAVIGIIILGMGLWIYNNRRGFEKKDLIPIAFFILAILSFTRISSIVTTLLVLIGIYFMGRESEHKTVYFMLAWIFSNIIFYSYYPIKVNRYLLPIFPAVIYFLLLSIDTINEKIKINKNIIPLILIALFLIQAFTFTMTFEKTHEFMAIEDVSDYIKDNNPDYENMSIGVFNVRAFNWWLGENLLPISSTDEALIDSCNATYYISNRVLDNVTNYTEIKEIDNIHIYEKIV